MVQAEDLSAWAFEIRKDLAFWSGEFAAALHWCLTRRTALAGPRAGVKFSGLRTREPLVPGFGGGGYLSGLVYRASLLVRVASLSRVVRRPLRPVLKHGPRSFTCARAIGLTKPKGAVKAKARQT